MKIRQKIAAIAAASALAFTGLVAVAPASQAASLTWVNNSASGSIGGIGIERANKTRETLRVGYGTSGTYGYSNEPLRFHIKPGYCIDMRYGSVFRKFNGNTLGDSWRPLERGVNQTLWLYNC